MTSLIAYFSMFPPRNVYAYNSYSLLDIPDIVNTYRTTLYLKSQKYKASAGHGIAFLQYKIAITLIKRTSWTEDFPELLFCQGTRPSLGFLKGDLPPHFYQLLSTNK